MMRGTDRWAVAVRLPDGSIEVDVRPAPRWVDRWARVPLVRGVVSLAESLTLGMRALTWSTERQAGSAGVELSRGQVGLTVAVAVALFSGLFIVLPAVVSKGAGDLLGNRVAFNVFEGLLRLGLFLGYIAAVGRMPDIRRVFQYHGAEHKAIAAFERTIISTDSPFDKYMLGDAQAMDEAAVRGMALFKGKARCILCHNGPNFTDNQFHNLGVPQEGPQKEDLGRYNVTRVNRDKGAFKTPTLRSITETAPYMHDGVFKTLEEVIDFLDKGGGPNPNLSPLMKPLMLRPDEKTDLIAFLKALTGAPVKISLPKLP